MKANELLLWLSARRQGTWQQFRNAVEELHLPSEAATQEDEIASEDADEPDVYPLHHMLRRNLEVLGHVEFFANDCASGWRVAPPVLAISEQSGFPIGVACGARSIGMLSRLCDAVDHSELRIEPQKEGPDIILLTARDQLEMEQVVKKLGLMPQRNASLAILGALSSVADFVSACVATDLPLGAETIQRFSVSNLAWQPSTREVALCTRQGLFRFKLRYQRMYFLCLNRKSYKVAAEIGKYFLLWRRRVRVLHYNPETQRLSVLAICRPPMLLERALVLCSGMLPSFDSESRTLSYGGIPEIVARVAFQSACQEAW